MVDLDILRAKGCSCEKLKELFTAKEKTKDVERLHTLLKSRIEETQANNICNWRIYQALDTAWDVPLKQITPTMLKSLIDSNMEVEPLTDALKLWGIDPSEVFSEVPDPKDPRRTLKKKNVMGLTRVSVSLIRAYVTIRRAKMMNDRKLVPFMKFEPAISKEDTRMQCEVVTSRVEQMAQEYGFWDIEDQACWRMLHYGICLRFPVEEWHIEEQLVEKDEDGESPYIGEDEGKYLRVRMKEGMRYHMPHPTRMGYDTAWPAHSFNTDSGASWALYWRVMRFGEIVGKKDFYNLDTIKVGDSAKWYSTNKAFFDNVYPCRLKFPLCAQDGAGDNDTEKRINDSYSVTADHDKGLVLTEHFDKLIPSEWGMGDYDCPVWFRFVLANYDTILYATPLPYCPVLYDGYDPVSGRSMNPSMSLEILPHEDQLSNLYSQYLLSVKNNLANMILVDEDVVNEEDITNLQKFSSAIWTCWNYVRFSSRRLFKSGQTPQVLYPQKFPQMDTTAIVLAMRTVIETLERILVMSAQELGQSASHEQTREEVRNIASNTSTRAQFTSSTLDRSRQAWKKQIYEGLMAYGSDEGYAQVPADPKITPELLSKFGFTWEEPYDKEKKKLTVRWTKTAIKYASFAANRDGDDRISDIEIARSLSAFMQQLLANPITAQAIGPDQAIAMANIIGKTAGLPRDFRLVNRGPDQTPEEQGQEIMQQVQQMIQEAVGQISQDFQGSIQQVIDVNDQQQTEIRQVMEILGQAPPEAQAGPPQGMQMQPPMQEMPPQALPEQGIPPGMPPGM